MCLAYTDQKSLWWSILTNRDASRTRVLTLHSVLWNGTSTNPHFVLTFTQSFMFSPLFSIWAVWAWVRLWSREDPDWVDRAKADEFPHGTQLHMFLVMCVVRGGASRCIGCDRGSHLDSNKCRPKAKPARPVEWGEPWAGGLGIEIQSEFKQIWASEMSRFNLDFGQSCGIFLDSFRTSFCRIHELL